jgi:Fe-S cluster biosynthesis and repair protein YggX
MSRIVFCSKLNKSGDGLDSPPLAGELGERIFEHISKEAWSLWLNHQTMLINEYRLNMSDPTARRFLKEELQTFLFSPVA